MRWNSSTQRLLAISCCLLTFASCSKSSSEQARASVSGVVLLDGEPLEGGVISFIPTAPTTGPSTMAAIVDGKFTLPRNAGPLVGTHRVEIIEEKEPEPDPDDAEAVKAYLASRKKAKRPAGIPKQYNRESNLTAEITEKGPNELEFKLVSKR